MKHKNKKLIAALCYALASARGALHDVVSDDYDKENIQMILDGTAWDNIIKATDLDDVDIEPDWNTFISNTEKLKIVGRK